MSTSKSCWTSFERDVVRTDWDSERTPLSGENSRHGGGDVIIPEGVSVLVECRLRARFEHHTMFEGVAEDAAKHKKTHPILYTRRKNQRGRPWLVTIDASLWTKIVKLPEVQEILKDVAD